MNTSEEWQHHIKWHYIIHALKNTRQNNSLVHTLIIIFLRILKSYYITVCKAMLWILITIHFSSNPCGSCTLIHTIISILTYSSMLKMVAENVAKNVPQYLTSQLHLSMQCSVTWSLNSFPPQDLSKYQMCPTYHI